jgi:hypothetical protein
VIAVWAVLGLAVATLCLGCHRPLEVEEGDVLLHATPEPSPPPPVPPPLPPPDFHPE